MGIAITAVSGNSTVSGNPTDAANAKEGVVATHEADVAALRRLWTGTSAAMAGTAVPIAGIGRARIKAAGILGLGAAIATWLLLLLALFEALFLLTIAAVHTLAAVLAATSVAGTSPLAFANGADGAPLALARWNNWRKWRSRRWERRRVGVVTFARRVVITFAFAFAPALTFAFTLTLTLAVASKFEDVVAVAATATALILAVALALAVTLTLAVALTLGFDILFLFHFGKLSREGVGVEGDELPTVDDVGMGLGGVVGGHILMVVILLLGICGRRST